MKKWLISTIAAAIVLLASTALADGSITLSPDGSTSTDASVRIDGQTVTTPKRAHTKSPGHLTTARSLSKAPRTRKLPLCWAV